MPGWYSEKRGYYVIHFANQEFILSMSSLGAGVFLCVYHNGHRRLADYHFFLGEVRTAVSRVL